jgi:lipopolysaccharide cholinephosphotransferase
MLLKNSLNQFERDWAEAPLRDKNLDFSKLSNKNIVISGNSMITHAIALALLLLNESKSSNNKIIVLCENNNLFYEYESRDDFQACSLNCVDSLDKIDIWIETDFLLEDKVTSPTQAKEVFAKANEIVSKLSAIKPDKLLLISDNSVYGKLERGFVASEYEAGKADFSCNSLRTLVMQSVENIFASAAHQFSFDLSILRSSVLVCPFSNSDFIRNLVNCISDEKKNTIALSGLTKIKTSYIYINDFITAVFYLLIYGENTVYNACSDNSTLSLPELSVILDELFDTDIRFDSNGELPIGSAVSNTKLKRLGWKPTVEIKDALLISKYAKLNSDEVFMFPDAYDGKLHTVQQILLGFLLEIDRICKKHNIKYFLAGGTLLGAIRHHGFIPWDDDADVMMLREDYDKFLKVLPTELPSNLFLQKNEKTSHFPFAKIRINNTVFSTEFTSRFNNVHNGIFFDVLAQDKTSNNEFIRKLHMHATASSRWLVLNKWRGTPVDANSKISSFIANVLKKIFPLSLLESVQNKLMSLYKNKKDAKYLFDSMGRNISRGEFPIEWLSDTILVDFEGVKLPVPKEYDKYLTYLYGDYMDMIPVSQRHVSHEIIQMDLSEYSNYNVKPAK